MFAFNSDVNESLQCDVNQVHSPNKSVNPIISQAITYLESKSLSGKFMCICSQTLGQDVSFLMSRRYKLHRNILMLN